jgi:hypothetical protein
MNETTKILSDTLYAWCCGNAKPAQVHRVFAAHGWKIDLRQPDTGAQMEAQDPNGDFHWIAC